MDWMHKTSSKRDRTKPRRMCFLWAIVCTETSELETAAAWVSVQETYHIIALFSLSPGHLLKSNV